MTPVGIFLIAAALTMSLAGALGHSASQSATSPPADPEAAAEERQLAQLLQCGRGRDAADRAENEATRANQLALIRRVEGGSDPVADARAAAARGDFRLIRGVGMGGTGALGVDCRTSHRNDIRSRALTLGTRFYSDVIGPCEPPNPEPRCRIDALLDIYGPAYNRTIVSHPAYPYADLCRLPTPNPPAWNRNSLTDPTEYGFPDLAPTGHPRDLPEAARRGTAAAVGRMLAVAPPGEIDRPDPYGMTPLAWAVARRRPEIAALFLARGADPLGRVCDDPGRLESPLRLALRTGQEALAQRFLRPDVVARATPWPLGLMRAAAQGGATSLLARMLREPHSVAISRLRQPGDGPLPAAVTRVFDTYERGLCWSAVLPAGTVVHMLGTYQARNATRRALGRHPGSVAVTVRSSQPVLLVLSGYEPIEWQVRLAPGSRLAGVFVTGMNRSTVSGDVRGIPTLINDQQDHCAALNGGSVYAYEAGDQQLHLAGALEGMFGRPVADFQASHNAVMFEVR